MTAPEASRSTRTLLPATLFVLRHWNEKTRCITQLRRQQQQQQQQPRRGGGGGARRRGEAASFERTSRSFWPKMAGEQNPDLDKVNCTEKVNPDSHITDWTDNIFYS
ncbi:uncharacterized protein V6R79_011688 [Siganus canaliculatus]